MKIEQFILLNDTEKEEIIFTSGVFFANYNEGDHMFDVFKLYDFYVSFCQNLKTDEKATIIAHIYKDRLTFCLN